MKNPNKSAGCLEVFGEALACQTNAATDGFDWPDIRPMWIKLDEEISELREAVEHDHSAERITDEVGDILFMVTNIARRLGVNPEEALAGCIRKFKSRYSYVVSRRHACHPGSDDITLEQLEVWWQEAKAQEK